MAPDSDSFLASSSRYFFRFLRLVIAAGLAYYLIYRFSLWLFPEIERATRDVTVERTVLLYNLVAAAFVLLLLVLVKVSIDYAKISTVVEERRSMVLAALRGAQFVDPSGANSGHLRRDGSPGPAVGGRLLLRNARSRRGG